MKESCSCKLNTANDPRQRVFVYGTLKRGESNHRWLEQAINLGDAETYQYFALYQGGDPWPLMVAGEPRYPVRGELYAVTPRELALLDELEACPQLYVRKQIAVRMITDEIIQAWAYFSVQPEGDLLTDGVWYSS